MCGITGFYRTSDNQLTDKEVTDLLVNLSERGRDATGVAWLKEEVLVLKTDVEARKFVELDEFKKNLPNICSSKWALFHVRNATHGDPTDNKNNHPIYSEKGLIVHNGVVSAKEELPADGECDSEQILRSIDKWGFDGIKNVFGSMAFAYAKYDSLDKFYLYRNYNPLIYTWVRGIFIFCSSENILDKSVGGISYFKSLDPYSLYEIGQYGLKRRREFAPMAVNTDTKPYNPITRYRWSDLKNEWEGI